MAQNIILECTHDKQVFDQETGEEICRKCGTVVNILESDDKKSNDIKENVSSINQINSTYIPKNNNDFAGSFMKSDQLYIANRIRKLDSIRNNERNKKKALQIIHKIKNSMSLNENIYNLALYYYEKIINLIKGRSIKEFVIATVYLACRELNIPRTIDEIANVCDGNEKYSKKCFRLIQKTLRVKLDPPKNSYYINKISNKLKIKGTILRKSLNLLQKVEKEHFSEGKNPNALSCAVLFYVCKKEKQKISQNKIADIANISVTTLRLRLAEIENLTIKLE